MNITLDTLSISQKLRSAGLTEDVANAITEAIRDAASLPDISHLATKDDLTNLRNALKAEIKALGYDLLKWTFVIILSASFVNVSATVGLLKLLNPIVSIEKPVEKKSTNAS